LVDSTVSFNSANGGAATNLLTPVIGMGGYARGGGIYNQGALTIVNCTLAENTAAGGLGIDQGVGGDGLGGGLANDGGSISLLNVTVASNRVVSLGATNVFVDAGQTYVFTNKPGNSFGSSIYNTNGTVTLTNLIFVCSPPQANVSGTVLDGGHNLASDSSAHLSAPGSFNNIDPRLGPLADNGGPTPTMALLPGSPAIDAGDTAAGPSTDQRGVGRPVGAASDIGAFEFSPTLGLSRSADGTVRLDYIFRPLQSQSH
jgi:hypothetical protein